MSARAGVRAHGQRAPLPQPVHALSSADAPPPPPARSPPPPPPPQGGPLANTVHDPRWGRASETYGEDPFLSRVVGRTATLNLQQRTPEFLEGSSFIKTSQVTRHFIGYHGANDLPHSGEEWVTPQWLEDQQLPGYEVLQTPEALGGGGAEGIMCGYAAFATAGDVPPPRNNVTPGGLRPWIPSCVNPFIMQTKLRDEWRSECFVQGDCCGSIGAQLDHDYFATLEEAVVASVNSGVNAAYEDYSGMNKALRAGLADGTLDPNLLDLRLKRLLLMRFRLGEFETAANPAFPWPGPFNESDLDGAAHRALARESAAKSFVLLENRAALLPLDPAKLPAQIAVVGAFSRCRVLFGNYGGHDHDDPDCTKAECSYGHSYSGSMSAVSTVFDALAEEAAAAGGGTSVQWAQGAQSVTACGADGVAQAVALAKASGFVVVVAGLGALVEVESRDRLYLTLPPPQQDLLGNISAAVGADRVVLVIISAGGVDVDPALASTVLWGGYPGEETGHGLVDVMMGRVAPSGRLPMTWYRDEYLARVAPVANFNMVTAGVGRTYRYYNQPDLLPRYWFGYGLAYGRFEYSAPAAALLSNGSVALSVSVQYTGAALASSAPAREAVQVYAVVPSVAGLVTPAAKLCAFALVELAAGAAPTTVTFTVPPYDLSTVDLAGFRRVTKGEYAFFFSGHLPFDTEGVARASNVVSASLTM